MSGRFISDRPAGARAVHGFPRRPGSTVPRPFSVLLLTAALALTCGCRSDGGAGPTDAPLPAAQRADGMAVVSIVDARTGRPIEGATFTAVPESETPVPATWWEARSDASDADGVARLALSDLTEEPWLLVRAEGYAPRMELTREPGPRIELERARDLEVEVRDLFERPVEGAAVSWFAGCGHTPDLAWARTDAAGRARLEGIASDSSAGDLWIAGPTLATDNGYAPDEGPALVRVPPGVAARGRVVDADGQPLAGVFVGAPRRHHGPWTRADSEGAFELPGVDPPVELQVLREPDSKAWLGGYEVPEDGRPVTLTVPSEDFDDESATTEVELLLRARESLEPLAGLAVEFVRLSDGFTVRRRSDEDGRVELRLAPGAWQLGVGGGFSGWEPALRRVALGSEPFAETLSLQPQPEWSFRLSQTHPEASAALVGEREVRELEAEELAGARVRVPREGRCAVRVELHDRVRVVPLDSVARRAGGELALELPEPLEVRARLVDPDGAPVRGALWVGSGDPPTSPEGLQDVSEIPHVRTWRAAPAHLWVLPADARFAPRRLARVLPWDATELDLGDVTLEPPGARRLTLLDAQGEPLAGARVVHFARLGRSEFETDSAGVFESSAHPAQAGDVLAVRPSDGGPSFHVALAGAGPWRVARPDTRVAFEVVGEDGRALESFEVVVAGEVFSGAGGLLELSGLDPGPHVAFVSADGRSAWRQPIDLDAGARIQARVVLTPR